GPCPAVGGATTSARRPALHHAAAATAPATSTTPIQVRRFIAPESIARGPRGGQPARRGRYSSAMSCCHPHPPAPVENGAAGGESAFAIDLSRIVFGRGALDEIGDHACALGCTRVALFTDRVVAQLEHVARAVASLRRHGIDVAIYDEVHVEP